MPPIENGIEVKKIYKINQNKLNIKKLVHEFIVFLFLDISI